MRRGEQIAAAIEANHFATLREFAQGESSELLVNAEMMRAASGVAYPLFNFVARPRFDPKTVDRRIQGVIAYFAERRLPFLFYVHPSSVPGGLGHHLQKHGLRPCGIQDGMALTRLNPTLHTHHDVTVEVAANQRTLAEAADVYAAAYHLPDDAAAHMCTIMNSVQQDPAVCIYLARLQGAPAGTLIMTLKAGGAGLYGLGTRPECRGQGVARSLMVRAIFDANALGFGLVVLQAPPGAVSLYRYLGFETYIRVEVYAGN
ncbi:MAG: GNAT family N-acetyltransferase [Anaerolineae bacterium]